MTEPGNLWVRTGARVTVVGADGDEEVYTIVGPSQANNRLGKISSESPMGRALMGRKVGDDVTIIAPGGSYKLRVQAIEI